MPLEDKVIGIVGLGLMGGSLGKALVQRRMCRKVLALCRRAEAAHEAVAGSAAHEADTTPELLKEADVVVLATPSRTIVRLLGELSPFYKLRAVVTDMGSVKRPIVEAMNGLPETVRAVGSHPMCGKEISGLSAADATLFQNKLWIISPTKRSTDESIELVVALATGVGARVKTMDADLHDTVAAAVSHFPMMLSAGLVATTERIGHTAPDVWELAASGFRDTTRIAAGDTKMVSDILLSNRDNVLKVSDACISILHEIQRMLAEGNDEELIEFLTRVRERRKGLFI